MKHKIATIYSCVECPHCRSDANKTRSLCSLSAYQFLWWDSSPEEELGTIPEWCALPDGPSEKGGSE